MPHDDPRAVLQNAAMHARQWSWRHAGGRGCADDAVVVLVHSLRCEARDMLSDPAASPADLLGLAAALQLATARDLPR